MRSTPLIPLARTTTGLDSIRTKIRTIRKEGVFMRIDAVVAKLTTIMELRIHQSSEKHDPSRFLNGKGQQATGKPKLSICELPGCKGQHASKRRVMRSLIAQNPAVVWLDLSNLAPSCLVAIQSCQTRKTREYLPIFAQFPSLTAFTYPFPLEQRIFVGWVRLDAIMYPFSIGHMCFTT